MLGDTSTDNTFADEVIQYFASTPLPENRIIIHQPEETTGRSSMNQSVVIITTFRMNDAGYINKTLEAINEPLPVGAFLIGCFETFTARIARKKVYQVPIVRHLLMLYEFIFLRALPRLKGLNKIYFFFSRGKDRLLSKAEMLGRLVCCGFEIMEYRSVNGLIWFLVKKKKRPEYDRNPSYGPVFAMPRIGAGGKIIHVYKMRTMHPYSEYLHEYMVSRNGYASSGKPAGDFRLTPWGKVLRKYWFDELPQLFNLLKGDLKLVGVRPVGDAYFKTIPADLQKLRLKQKPGCIPPYVALNMKSDVQSVQQAERIYLLEKETHPFTTDFRYFAKALYNIILKQKRSA